MATNCNTAAVQKERRDGYHNNSRLSTIVTIGQYNLIHVCFYMLHNIAVLPVPSQCNDPQQRLDTTNNSILSSWLLFGGNITMKDIMLGCRENMCKKVLLYLHIHCSWKKHLNVPIAEKKSLMRDWSQINWLWNLNLKRILKMNLFLGYL